MYTKYKLKKNKCAMYVCNERAKRNHLISFILVKFEQFKRKYFCVRYVHGTQLLSATSFSF